MLDRTSSSAGSAAISSAPASGIRAVPEAGPNPGSGTDDWFYDCAVAVFGKSETGAQLHLATGWPRTSCYAFVARDPDQRRKPSPDFLRILFQSDHGLPFFMAFMDGSSAGWWRHHKRIAKQVDLAERFVRQFQECTEPLEP